MGDLGCFSSALTGESDSLTVPEWPFPKVFSTPLPEAESSGVGTGGRGVVFGGIIGVIERAEGVCAKVKGGTSITCGNEAISGLMRENASEILLESVHSTGDLIAMMLVGENGGL